MKEIKDDVKVPKLRTQKKKNTRFSIDSEILKGIKISFGIIITLIIFLTIAYSGSHYASNILGGTFLGNYTFNGYVNFKIQPKVNNNNLLFEEGPNNFTAYLLGNTDPNVVDTSDININISINGTYYKIGKLVYIELKTYLKNNTYDNSTLFKITNLPYISMKRAYFSLGHLRGIYFRYGGSSKTIIQHSARVLENTSVIQLSTSSNGESYSGFWYVNYDSSIQSKIIEISGTYLTN